MAALPKLNHKQITCICEHLANWDGKLTWQSLRKWIKMKWKIDITRQALNEYYAIKKAYSTRKDELRYGANASTRPAVKHKELNLSEALKIIDKQKITIKQLEQTRDRQLEVLSGAIENVKKVLPGNRDLRDIFKPVTSRKTE